MSFNCYIGKVSNTIDNDTKTKQALDEHLEFELGDNNTYAKELQEQKVNCIEDLVSSIIATIQQSGYNSAANIFGGSINLVKQIMLQSLGFYDGTIDTTRGPIQCAAERKFQTHYQLSVDGFLGTNDFPRLAEIVFGRRFDQHTTTVPQTHTTSVNSSSYTTLGNVLNPDETGYEYKLGKTRFNIENAKKIGRKLIETYKFKWENNLWNKDMQFNITATVDNTPVTKTSTKKTIDEEYSIFQSIAKIVLSPSEFQSLQQQTTFSHFDSDYNAKLCFNRAMDAVVSTFFIPHNEISGLDSWLSTELHKAKDLKGIQEIFAKPADFIFTYGRAIHGHESISKKFNANRTMRNYQLHRFNFLDIRQDTKRQAYISSEGSVKGHPGDGPTSSIIGTHTKYMSKSELQRELSGEDIVFSTIEQKGYRDSIQN